tara:strand:- start:77 stop:484 length:408 start_codon:yes stop_codon:yes gene_type:complete
MKKIKTLELTYESFHRLKTMLSSGDEEDREVALQTLSNMKTSDVLMTLLAKSLYHHSRYTLMNDERFKNRFLTDGNNMEWQQLYPLIKKHLDMYGQGNLEKKLLEESIVQLVTDHLLYDNFHNIVKNIEIELNYE